MNRVQETRINILSEGTKIKGEVSFDHSIRVHGSLEGNVKATPGSVLVLGETAVVEGNIQADVIYINGFIKGDVEALTKIEISGTGRVIGNVKAPKVNIEFGAFLEGKCEMENLLDQPTDTSTEKDSPISGSRPSPATA